MKNSMHTRFPDLKSRRSAESLEMLVKKLLPVLFMKYAEGNVRTMSFLISVIDVGNLNPEMLI